MADAAREDYYAVLGVPRDASPKAIKDAFRKLTLKYHPDRSKEPQAAERFKAIAAAYAVLSDPEKRAAYDARGRSAEAYSPEDLFGGIDLGDWLGATGLGGDWIERLFGVRRRSARRGIDLEAHLEVSLERVRDGGDERLTFLRPASCPGCAGTGYQTAARRGEPATTSTRVRCRTCRGSGDVDVEDSVVLHLPAGIEEGAVLRVRERGGPAVGGRPGDLLVVVTTKRDPHWLREGSHLRTRTTVEVADAALGGEVVIRGLRGPLHVRVPPGTQPGTVLRLRSEGLPEPSGPRRGDLFVVVDVHVPEHLSDEAKRAFESLRTRRN